MKRPDVVEWREGSTVQTSVLPKGDPSSIMESLSPKKRGALALAFVLNNEQRKKKGLKPQTNGLESAFAAHIVRERRIPKLLQKFMKDKSKVVFESISYALKQKLGQEIDAEPILDELRKTHGLTDDAIKAEMKKVDDELAIDHIQLNEIGKQEIPQAGLQNAPLLLKARDENNQLFYVLLEKGKMDNQAGKFTIPGKMSNKQQIEASLPLQPLRGNALKALEEINQANDPANQVKISEHPVYVMMGENNNPDTRNYVYEAIAPLKAFEHFAANQDATSVKVIPATAEGVNDFFTNTPSDKYPAYVEPLFRADLARIKKRESIASLRQAAKQAIDATHGYVEAVAPGIGTETRLTAKRWNNSLATKRTAFHQMIARRRTKEGFER